MRVLTTMRAALADPNIFGAVLPGPSWAAWRVILIATMGEPLSPDETKLFRKLTGRDYKPGVRVDELWAIVGRRGGKTRASAVLAAYIACLIDWTDVLAPGEIGALPVISATRDQAKKLMQYLDGLFHDVPALKKLVEKVTGETILLSTRVQINVSAANFRSVRGSTAVSAIVDEAAFLSAEVSVNPDAEILAALRPAMATTHGMLIVITSPHAKRGVVWEAYRKHFGKASNPKIMVVNAPSILMNGTLSKAWVAEQKARDPARAVAEYDARFRDDVESYLSDEQIRACIRDAGRVERSVPAGKQCVAFVDAATGAGQDSMTMAVAYSERASVSHPARTYLLCVREWRPPFSPSVVVEELIETISRYGVKSVTGDRFAKGWVSEAFASRGVTYRESEKTKSDFYREFAPLVTTGVADLLDLPRLVSQLLDLERTLARGTGRETIDHIRGGHDDLANAVAGAMVLASEGKSRQWSITPEVLKKTAIPPRMFF